jgi:hypothetical protein
MIKKTNLPTPWAAGRWCLPFAMGALCFFLAGTQSCKVYSFKDVSIPVDIKTIHISFLENKAQYVNPQLSPQLTDKLKQKISTQTRLTEVQSADADYDVSGYVSDYRLSTSGVSGQQAATNRLTVSVHITLKNKLADRKIGKSDFDTDLSRNFDFSSNLSLGEAEAQLTTTIISNMTDEIFNRIFSSW